MTSSNGPAHVVVDGSNIATEGRSLPSLAQLSEAVMSFMEEYPDAAITVVVDATFGHRIDKKEVKEFEEGISNNELVALPPVPSDEAMPSSSPSRRSRTHRSCRTTPSRSSMPTTTGSSTRGG